MTTSQQTINTLYKMLDFDLLSFQDFTNWLQLYNNKNIRQEFVFYNVK